MDEVGVVLRLPDQAPEGRRSHRTSLTLGRPRQRRRRVFVTQPSEAPPLQHPFGESPGAPEGSWSIRGSGRYDHERQPVAGGDLRRLEEIPRGVRRDGMHLVEQQHERGGVGADPLREQGHVVVKARARLGGDSERGDLHPRHAPARRTGPSLQFPHEPVLIPERAGREPLGPQSEFSGSLTDTLQEDRFPVAPGTEIEQPPSGPRTAGELGEPPLGEFQILLASRKHRRHLTRPRPERISIRATGDHPRSVTQPTRAGRRPALRRDGTAAAGHRNSMR